MSNTESDLIDFSNKTFQMGNYYFFVLFCNWKSSDIQTSEDFETCITCICCAQAYSFSPERVFEPGCKGADTMRQLTLANV